MKLKSTIVLTANALENLAAKMAAGPVDPEMVRRVLTEHAATLKAAVALPAERAR